MPIAFQQKAGTTWLYETIKISFPRPPLQQALLAIAVTRYGRFHHDKAIIRQGHLIYGKALSFLQQALYDQHLMLHDHILAAVCLMEKYEVLESTSQNVMAWINHVSGLARIIEARGPLRHRSQLSRVMFEHSRYLVMIRDIMTRRSSNLSQEAWLLEPWHGLDKNLEQKVYDLGFKFAVLLKDTDELSTTTNTIDAFANILQKCNNLLATSQVLDKEYLSELLTGQSIDSEKDLTTSFDLESYLRTLEGSTVIDRPAQLFLGCTLWGFQVAVLAILSLVHSKVEASPSHPQAIYAETFEQARLHLNTWTPSDIARKVLTLTTFCLGRDTGLIGSSRAILPLQCALWQFDPGQPEYEQCERLLQKLTGRGLQFVADLEQDSERWPIIMRRAKTGQS